MSPSCRRRLRTLSANPNDRVRLARRYGNPLPTLSDSTAWTRGMSDDCWRRARSSTFVDDHVVIVRGGPASESSAATQAT